MRHHRNRSFKHNGYWHHIIEGRLYREVPRGLFRLNDLVDVAAEIARDQRLFRELQAESMDVVEEVRRLMVAGLARQLDAEILRSYDTTPHDWDKWSRDVAAYGAGFPIKPIDPRLGFKDITS